MNLGRTVNLAMNEILSQYQNHFNEVHCLCPSDDYRTGVKGSGGIIYHTVDYYKGSKIAKIFAILKGDKEFLERIILDQNIEIVQYRIPSFFSLGFYYCFKSIKVKKTTYIAGDMYENLTNNFKQVPFIKLFAQISEWLQFPLIRNSVVVSTGPVLAEKYSKQNPNIHAYFSTTHNNVKVNKNESIEECLRIVFLGRIDEAKRVGDIVEASKILKDRGVDYTVDIIGEGPSLKFIKSMVDNFDLNSHFNFHGYISDRDKIDDILTESHVMVLPSITEGTAKVLPEAMSRGVVPIAVRGVGSNNFIIADKNNGMLFNKMDVQDLAEKLVLIRLSNEDFLNLRNQCYEYAKERTASREIQKMWNFILAN
ncbi:glycosyltransferase [Sphingobacterium humi]|uniref:Glycosyltransferase n=1 Tax=Sphingobacterium humi TaxID=1796905 RepID=A0A6N8L2X6_9SPHI|nr:glycosyltransferase [Sphingobacterium humi]MVZ63647.1 glycosyltransferase [Sphingobacterium humi]